MAAARLRRGIHLSGPASGGGSSSSCCAGGGGGDDDNESDTGWPSPAPRPKYVYPPRLESGSRELAQHLDSHGYAVAKQVLTRGECDHAVAKLWDFLEQLGSGIDRADITTWGAPRWPSPSGSIFVASHGANHCEAAWYVRSRPALAALFGSLWDTEEQLLVNFDALSVHRPWWHPDGDLSWRAKSGGYHVDQSSMHPGRFAEPPPAPDHVREYVQGCVNLLPMSPHTGGHAVVPGSHAQFTPLMAKHGIRQNGFPIPPSEPLLKTGVAVMPHMEAGDVLLFDTRTIQCGAPGLTPPPASVAAAAAAAPPELLHVEVYVTMSPKSLASAATLQQRRRGYAENAAFGSHAAHHLLATMPAPAAAADHDRDGGEGRFTVVPAAALSADALALVG